MACVDSSRSSLAGLGHLYVFTAIKDTRAGIDTLVRVAGCLVDITISHILVGCDIVTAYAAKIEALVINYMWYFILHITVWQILL